jgi:hypothetical protein
VKLAAENCRPTRFGREVVDIIQEDMTTTKRDQKKDQEQEQSHEPNQKQRPRPRPMKK